VRWGDQTWEKMMLGFFSVLPTNDDVAGGIISKDAPAEADAGDGE
jgi:hypothetical protein